MTDPMTDPLYHDPAFAQYYDCHTGWSADKEWCRQLAGGGGSVLDLGCGTGLLTARLAQQGNSATGVDPAAAMLAIARSRSGSEQSGAEQSGAAGVTWVQGDARTIRLGATFDLIVMTGHAFQVALTDADRRAFLQTIAAHLAPQGRFIFDARNPLAREWESWTPDLTRCTLQHPTLGPLESWHDIAWDPMRKVATYDTFYQRPADPDPICATSQIGFVSQHRLAALIAKAGLRVDRWMGAWDGRPYDDGAPEIIVLGSLAPSDGKD